MGVKQTPNTSSEGDPVCRNCGAKLWFTNRIVQGRQRCKVCGTQHDLSPKALKKRHKHDH
jgi:DNA-directed RNA polymerase subunit M/transcription elongation factor TFIIS